MSGTRSPYSIAQRVRMVHKPSHHIKVQSLRDERRRSVDLFITSDVRAVESQLGFLPPGLPEAVHLLTVFGLESGFGQLP